ncbi:MAG: flagellar filament capping protein FliD [Lachnospiraceae bacterium]
MAAIDTVFNYYLSTYGNSSVNRYDTHKKSELRTIYNNMIKLNKESPLVKIKNLESGDIQKFAIDVKESSRTLEKVTAALSGEEDSLLSAFKKRIATSSLEDTVSAVFVGDSSSDSDLSSTFNIEVKHLASPQINMGNFLQKDNKDIPLGRYTFDFNTPTTGYEFQYAVSSGDTNYDVQNKIAKLISSANVGVKAEVVDDDSGCSAIKLTSTETGLAGNEESLFQILPGTSRESQSVMQTLAFDHISKDASSSQFLLNGNERSSLSNTFTINKEFEVTLKAISPEHNPASIGFKNDVDAISENLQTLVDAYNQVVQTSTNYNFEDSNQHSKLYHDITSVAKSYKNELDSMGLTVADDGFIRIDKALLEDGITSEHASVGLEDLNNFKNSLRVRSSRISLNPMSYVDKTIVVYKNPGRTFNAPYISSIYSGMMLDKYC